MTELIERFPGLTFGKIDKDSCRISGVSILRETSKNCSFAGKGRKYSEAAMASVARLVNNVKAYADHAGNRQLEATRGVRSIKDLIGYFSGGRIDNGVIRADLNFLENQKAWIVPLAEQMSDKIGMSVHCYGPSALDRATQTEIVEDVTTLRSVDLVSEPGSTSGLFESRNSDYWITKSFKELSVSDQEIDEDFRKSLGIRPDKKRDPSEDERFLQDAVRGHDDI